ncbi:MAG: glycosyltransferase family 2 protein [Prevotella sp.]|nr:glycosyltransferase family 2 protein [Prevotella sp.]
MVATKKRTIDDNKSGGGKYPLVSIAVPVYKVEPFIERCARSLFEQTYENLEFIFVDDASPDKSIQILERVILDYPERASNVRILHHETNRRLSETRNTLVDNARGEFILHVDSDDWVELNAVELLVNKQLETGADIVTGNMFIHDGERVAVSSNSGWNLSREIMLEKCLMRAISDMNCGRLIRRQLYVVHGVRADASVSCNEDFLVIPRLFYYAITVAGIEDCIYHYIFCHVNSISYLSRHDSNIYIEDTCVVLSRLADFFADKEKIWNEAMEKCKVITYHYMMLMAASQKNLNGYITSLNLLKQTDSRFWNLVRWNKYFFRKLESNYFMARQTYPVRMFLQKLKNNYAKNR